MRQFSESNGNYWNRAMQDVHVFEVSPVGLISLCDTVLTHFNQWYAIFLEGGTVYYRWMCISFRFWISVDSVPISAHINFRCWCADIADLSCDASLQTQKSSPRGRMAKLSAKQAPSYGAKVSCQSWRLICWGLGARIRCGGTKNLPKVETLLREMIAQEPIIYRYTLRSKQPDKSEFNLFDKLMVSWYTYF